jgi:hypothetical protein
VQNDEGGRRETFTLYFAKVLARAKEKREFRLSLFHRPDEFPSAEAGHPVDTHLINLTAGNGLPKIVLFHFFISFSFLLVLFSFWYYNNTSPVICQAFFLKKQKKLSGL